MSRWFRHYAGMMRDEKLVRAAMAAKQPVERVVWVWGAILESAAEINDGGRYELDPAEAAYFLRADENDIRAIQEALASASRVDGDTVVKWGARQFQSDRSNARQAAYRERKAQHGSDFHNPAPSCDGEVTAASRHGDAPETDTESEYNGGGERPDLALTLASELAAICGYPTPDDWPAGWCGSPHWVQKCLNEGWRPEVMRAETEAIVKRKRDGPIEHFSYLEKPLARAHARAQAPLPKVEIPTQETIYAQPGRSGERRNELRDVLRELRNETSGGEAVGPGSARLLSHG